MSSPALEVIKRGVRQFGPVTNLMTFNGLPDPRFACAALEIALLRLRLQLSTHGRFQQFGRAVVGAG